MFSLELFILTQRYHMHFFSPYVAYIHLESSYINYKEFVLFSFMQLFTTAWMYSSASIFFFKKCKQEFETFCPVKHHQSNFITSDIAHFKLLKFKETKKGFFLSVKWYEQDTVFIPVHISFASHDKSRKISITHCINR